MISEKNFSSNFETSTILFKENFINSFDDIRNNDNDNSNKISIASSSSSATGDNQSNTDSGTSNQETLLTKENKLKNSKNIRTFNSPLKSQSFQDLHSKATRKRYQHVKSKVKQYITELQAEDALIKSKKSMCHRSLPENLSNFSRFPRSTNNNNDNLDRDDTIINDISETNPENLIKILQNKEEEIRKLKTLNEHLQENLKEKSTQLATIKSNADSMRFELVRIKDKERRMSYDYNNLNNSSHSILMSRVNGIRNIPSRSSLPFINYQDYHGVRENEMTNSRNSIATQTTEDSPDNVDNRYRSISSSPFRHTENYHFTEILKKENEEINSDSSSIRCRSGHSIKSSNYCDDNDDHDDIHSNISTVTRSGSIIDIKNNLKSDSEIETDNNDDDDDDDTDSPDKYTLLQDDFGYDTRKTKKLRNKKTSRMNCFQKFAKKFVCCKRTESFNDGYSYDDIKFSDF